MPSDEHILYETVPKTEVLKEMEAFASVQIQEVQRFINDSGFRNELPFGTRVKEVGKSASADGDKTSFQMFFTELNDRTNPPLLRQLAKELKKDPRILPTGCFMLLDNTTYEGIEQITHALDLAKKNAPEEYNQIANAAMSRAGIGRKIDYASMTSARSSAVIQIAVVNDILLRGIEESLRESDDSTISAQLGMDCFQDVGDRINIEFGFQSLELVSIQNGFEEVANKAHAILTAEKNRRMPEIKQAREALSKSLLPETPEGTPLSREVFQSDEATLKFVQSLRIAEDYSQLVPDKILKQNLPGELLALRGLGQYGVHGNFDPLEHSLRVTERAVTEVGTEGLTPEGAEVLRVTALLHDIGKRDNPLNVNHAYISEQYAVDVLAKMGYDPKNGVGADILQLIRNHDAYGVYMKGEATISKTVDAYTPNPDSVLTLSEMVELGRRMYLSDVGTMQGIPRWPNFVSDVSSRLGREVIPLVEEEISKRVAEMAEASETPKRKIKFNTELVDEHTWHEMAFDVGVEFQKGNEGDIVKGLVLKFMESDLARHHEKSDLNISVSNLLKNPGKLVGRFNEYIEDYFKEDDPKSEEFFDSIKWLVADTLMEQACKSIETDPKYFHEFMILMESRKLMGSKSEQYVPALSHGTSSIALETIIKSGYLKDRRSLVDAGQTVLTGEGDNYVSKTDAQNGISLSTTAETSLAYATVHNSGMGYAINPEVARVRLQHELDLQLGSFERVEKQFEDFKPLTREQITNMGKKGMDEYREKVEALRTTASHLVNNSESYFKELAPPVKSLMRRASSFSFVASMPPEQQRNLYDAYQVVIGIDPAKVTLESDHGAAWLNEVYPKENALLAEDFTGIYVPHKNIAETRDMVLIYMQGNDAPNVGSTEVLKILRSIESNGESDAKYEDIVARLQVGASARLKQHKITNTKKVV